MRGSTWSEGSNASLSATTRRSRDRTPACPQLRGGPLAKVVGAGLQIGARARERTVVPELLEQLPGDGLEAR